MEEIDALLVEHERGVRGPGLAPAVPLDDRQIERGHADRERDGAADDREPVGESEPREARHPRNGRRASRRRKTTRARVATAPSASSGVLIGVDRYCAVMKCMPAGTSKPRNPGEAMNVSTGASSTVTRQFGWYV